MKAINQYRDGRTRNKGIKIVQKNCKPNQIYECISKESTCIFKKRKQVEYREGVKNVITKICIVMY